MRFPRLQHLGTVYSDDAAEYPHVMAAQGHVVLSLPMFAEWVDLFSARLLHGQRTDLRKHSN